MEWEKMKLKWKIYAVLLFCLSLGVFASQRACYAFGLGRFTMSMPGPLLLYPGTDDIDLKSKAFLEFKWERTDIIWTDHYELRLYKGYQTTQNTLLLKKEISVHDYPFKLDASVLEVGQVYTWSLTQVYNDGRKSDKSFASFKLIKK